MDGLWGTADILAVRCGYLEPKEMEGGHSAIWVDISFTNALSHNPPTHSTPQVRHLQMSQLATVKKYLRIYKADILKHDLPGRQFCLEASTQPGVPLTAAQAKEAKDIDLLKTKAMLRAQKKCKHLYMGTVSFSGAVDLPCKPIQFWSTAIRCRKGCKVSVNLWKQQKKKARVDVSVRGMTDEDLDAQLRLARRDYHAAKKRS